MKKLSLYSIKDKKLGVFWEPTSSYNDVTAMRQLQNHLRSGSKSLLVTHADDFDLYKIGEFCESSGITPIEPQCICSVAALALDPDEEVPV